MKTLKNTLIFILKIMIIRFNELVFIGTSLLLWATDKYLFYEFGFGHLIFLLLVFPFYAKFYLERKLYTNIERTRDIKKLESLVK